MTFTPKFVDMVRNLTTVQGTGPVTLGQAVSGYTGIAQALSAGEQFYYCIQGVDKPQEREVGRGTLQADGKVAREPIAGSATNFSNGTKTIALVAAAEWFSKLEQGAGGSIEAATRGALAVTPPSRGPMMLTEAGREGLFVFDTGDLAAKVANDPRQAVYVPPASAATGAEGAWVRRFSGAVNVRWFGAVGDDVANDGPAFAAAVAYCKSIAQSGYGYGDGSPPLFIPSGTYFLGTTTLDITHSLIIEGENCGGPAGASTVLRWADGTTGIRIQAFDTTGATAGDGTIAYSDGAAMTTIRNLHLRGGFSGTESEAHGVHLRVKAVLRDLMIHNFPGDGVHSNASTGATTNRGNTNSSIVDNVFVQSCRDGIHVEQVDANAWIITNPYTVANRRYGIWKKTTLGSTIIGGDSSTNGCAQGFPTMCSHGGNRYYCLPDQEGWAAANPPSGTTAHNEGWGFLSAGGTAMEFPAWTSGMAVRAGGALRIEGDFENNVVVGWYKEPDQAPAQIRASAKTLWLSPMGGYPVMFDGSIYRGVLAGEASGFRTFGSLHVGSAEMGAPVAGCTIRVDGDAYLTRPGSVVHDPMLHINSTNAFATIAFEHHSNPTAYVQHFNGFGTYYINLTNLPHQFYVNGGKVGEINSAGLALESGRTLTIGGTPVLTDRMPAQADSSAADVAGLKADFNALLAKLRGVSLLAS